MTAPATNPAPALSAAERFQFDVNGYLVLENFLAPGHTARLKAAIDAAIVRRRRALPEGWVAQWPPRNAHDLTQVHGERSTRILNVLEEDPLFLELLTWPALMPYVHGLINPAPHYHASDAIVEDPKDFADRVDGWHLDGHDNGYRRLGHEIPLLQLKVGYYISDMTQPWRGNLTLVPGSHHSRVEPTREARQRRDFFPGAVQLCAPVGSAILFHNAIWHTAAPYGEGQPGRTILYYAYEHPWMLGSTAHWGYSRDFYNRKLAPEQRSLFHGFVFDPPELRF